MLFKAIFFAAAASALNLPRAVDPTVTISSGVLVGTASAVSNQPSQTKLATAYLGIPYAASPTRFAPPVAPSSWATKTVKTMKPICYQQFPPDPTGSILASFGENPFGPTPLPQTEDCLNLNVFVPPGTTPTSGRPVLFYIYGGNLETGGNALQEYNGSSLAVNNGVIVVVPNYRTNFFGFSNSPDIPFGKQNSGFLDQRFALQWVQKNIKAFGGDPAKVTIFGQSAGAYSVKQLIVNPPSPVGFRAAIMQSSAHLPGDGPGAFKNISTHFGCNNPPSGQTQTDCLRKIAAKDIQTYIVKYNVRGSPVQGDGTYDASQTLDKLKNKQFADVPLFIGTNLNEISVFAYSLGLNDQSPLIPSIATLTGIDLSSVNDLASHFSATGFALIDRAGTDAAFTCPNHLFANAYSENANSKVYRYRYDASFKSTRYFAQAGAYHQSEIPEVWGTYPLVTKYGSADPIEIALSKYMSSAWTNFAKDPSGGPDPGNWPEFTTSDFLPQFGVLGGVNNTSGLDVEASVIADYPCPVFDPILQAAGFAY